MYSSCADVPIAILLYLWHKCTYVMRYMSPRCRGTFWGLEDSYILEVQLNTSDISRVCMCVHVSECLCLFMSCPVCFKDEDSDLSTFHTHGGSYIQILTLSLSWPHIHIWLRASWIIDLWLRYLIGLLDWKVMFYKVGCVLHPPKG